MEVLPHTSLTMFSSANMGNVRGKCSQPPSTTLTFILCGVIWIYTLFGLPAALCRRCMKTGSGGKIFAVSHSLVCGSLLR